MANSLDFDFDYLGYEYDNIQAKLNRMSEYELTTEYAQNLMDRVSEIRKICRWEPNNG